MKPHYIALSISLLLAPLVALAAPPGDLKALFTLITELINTLIAIVATMALLYFVWGLAQFILNDTGSEDVAQKAKNIMLWGTLALFVLFSIWGIIALLNATFIGGGGSNVPGFMDI